MTDERYVFQQTERERKRISRGAYNKKNGSKSKMCRLPSDGMTKAEKQAMNGEVMSYELNKPMNWNQFKVMPNDIQKEYLLKLTDELGAGRKEVADMFGVNTQSLSDYLLSKHKGVCFFRGKRRNTEAFMKWLCSDTAENVKDSGSETEVIENKRCTFNEVVEAGNLILCGTAKDICGMIERVIGNNTRYKVQIKFTKDSLEDMGVKII